jgi:23S rRNA pseudouridine2605 synthase
VPTERLAKVIARSGASSRRQAEELVYEQRVQVNGQIATHPGHPVDPAVDAILLDGKPIVPRTEGDLAYFLFHKPKGLVTTRSDEQGRATIFDHLGDLPVRVESVGRLDLDTEGALLLTNDGMLAHKLTHPSSRVEKRYLAKVHRTPEPRTLRRIEQGIELDDGMTAPCVVKVLETTDAGNAWIEVAVTEGRNRLVRRLFEAVGHPVSKLRRIAFAGLTVEGLPVGAIRPLTAREIRSLQALAAPRGDPAPRGGASGGTKPRGAGRR